MHFYCRNINDAFHYVVRGIHEGTIPTHVMPSRYGEVAMIEEPVIITYSKPKERVLFNQQRDHNCFFALYEALWMLAGRNDVAPLVYYCSRMKEFSDDGSSFNGAYGYRWRHAEASPAADEYVITDQLNTIVAHLKALPWSRRAVLNMWNVEDDLLKIGEPGQYSKDVCCNLNVLFSIEPGRCRYCNGLGCKDCDGKPHDVPRYLNMTVMNRSNDLVLGLFGANYVHFTILQEYMAARLQLDVGVYHHITNNLHVYTNNWEPEKWLSIPQQSHHATLALVSDSKAFEEELPQFVEAHKGPEEPSCKLAWTEPFLRDVASPMFRAFHAHKQKDRDKEIAWLARIGAADWNIAATEWMQRREAKHVSK